MMKHYFQCAEHRHLRFAHRRNLSILRNCLRTQNIDSVFFSFLHLFSLMTNLLNSQLMQPFVMWIVRECFAPQVVSSQNDCVLRLCRRLCYDSNSRRKGLWKVVALPRGQFLKHWASGTLRNYCTCKWKLAKGPRAFVDFDLWALTNPPFASQFQLASARKWFKKLAPHLCCLTCEFARPWTHSQSCIATVITHLFSQVPLC